jgi:hypothetical protein
MKVLVLALVLFAGLASAEVLSFTDIAPGTEVTYTGGEALPPGPPVEGLTFYTDRTLFETTYPSLTFEDYSSTIVPPNSVQSDTGPFDYYCNNSCFTLYSIVEGIALDNLTMPGQNMVVLTPAFMGVVYVSCGPNTFTDDSYFEFTDPVNAFGVDIIMPNGTNPVNLSIYGPSGLLGTTTASGGMPGTFWGVYSDSDNIVKIECVDPNGAGELFSNCLFGYFTPLERTTWGARSRSARCRSSRPSACRSWS